MQPSNDLHLKLLQIDKAKTDKPVLTGNRLAQHFTKEEIPVASERRQWCSASSVVRKMQMKPHVILLLPHQDGQMRKTARSKR